MEILHPKFDIDLFFHSLCTAERSLLILDYDGTLAPFMQDPSLAIPYPGVCERIQLIMKTGRTKIVIMSGRSLDSLMKLIPIAPIPELWGSHGGERLIPGNASSTFADTLAQASEAIKEATAIAALHASELFCENKPFSVALHWRGKENIDALSQADKVENEWIGLARKYGMELHHFDGGIELRIKGINKGKAVRALLEEFPSDTLVAYLGDDFTDEDAFNALTERMLKVLVRKKSRATIADIRLSPPDELLQFLDRWINCIRGKSA